MNKLKISRKEIKKSIPMLMLVFFGYYILEAIRGKVDDLIGIPHLILGIVGVIFTLFFFKVE